MPRRIEESGEMGSVRSNILGFARNQSGAATVNFGLMVGMVALLSGGVTDLGFADRARMQLESVADILTSVTDKLPKKYVRIR